MIVQSMELSLPTSYSELKQEYLATFASPESRATACPPKQTSVLRRLPDGMPVVLASAMLGQLSDGTSGVKSLWMDESGYTLHTYTTLFSPKGRCFVLNSTYLTAVRSGLMAVLAADLLVGESDHWTVGLIGVGNIGLETARAFHEVWGIKRFITRGSARQRDKNAGRIRSWGCDVIVDDGCQPGVINTADIVVTATSALDRADVLERDQLVGSNLYIAMDSGYLLGPSFRQDMPSYSDYPEQLAGHVKDEFPYDEATPLFQALLDHPDRVLWPVAVYLYGIALADLVCAREAVKRKVPYA